MKLQKINYEKNRMLKVVVHINILGLLFVLICFASCKADCSEQNHCIENNTEQNNSVQNNILILLYPIATPENVRYSINVQDHFVRFVYHDSMPPDSIDVNLNESEYNSIKLLCDSVDSSQPIKIGEEALDTWELSLFINDKLVYQCLGYDFDSPPYEISQLINYIIKFSPKEIDLYGFA